MGRGCHGDMAVLPQRKVEGVEEVEEVEEEEEVEEVVTMRPQRRATLKRLSGSGERR